MPIGPLPLLDRTAPTFRADVDRFFLSDLPAWSAQLADTEANINARDVTTSQAAQAAGEAAGMASDSEHAADQHRAAAAGHDASAQAAAQAAQNGVGLPALVPGTVLKALPAGGIAWESVNPADMGLGRVNNTSDEEKPVSTPQAAALLAKKGGVATALGQTGKDHGVIAAGGIVTIDINEASVHRIEAAGSLEIKIVGWAGGNVSQELELQCIKFGGKTVIWPAGLWVKADRSRVPAVSNAGINWLATGQNDVLVRHDFDANVYVVM